MKDVRNLKIAYIGGGSRNWARILMNDLAKDGDISGKVYLHDIDVVAAKGNAIIGNMLTKREDVAGKWEYVVAKDLTDALTGADFVILSILPGTFDEMESDVHSPEKYGVYQSVGDSVGFGGIVRAMRTLPYYVEFAKQIEKVCPNAWVINFTNPMTMCVGVLYKTFPKIKAFGCCHEVFGTQKLFADILKDKTGIEANREDIKINVLGVNHFTFINQAKYKDMDLMPMLDEFVKNHPDGIDLKDDNWFNNAFACKHKVKFDLYKRYGLLGAAGDRHLSEFCPSAWYLKNPEQVKEYGFGLTKVSQRRKWLVEKLERTQRLIDGEKLELFDSGEESVRQMKALLGLEEFVTNVNIPNIGQEGGIKFGAVVETNACFSGDSVKPVMSGELPVGLNALVSKIVEEQESVVDGVIEGDYLKIFNAFCNTPNNNLTIDESKELFLTMLDNTKNYLPNYDERLARFLENF